MYYAILALVDPGDEVIVPGPGYPIYESVTRFVGGAPVATPIRQETRSASTRTSLPRWSRPRTKPIVINSPANPTGGVSPGQTSSGSPRSPSTTTSPS